MKYDKRMHTIYVNLSRLEKTNMLVISEPVK